MPPRALQVSGRLERLIDLVDQSVTLHQIKWMVYLLKDISTSTTIYTGQQAGGPRGWGWGGDRRHGTYCGGLTEGNLTCQCRDLGRTRCMILA